MKILMQEGASHSELTYTGYDISIVGEVVDDRGDAAVDHLRKNSSRTYKMKYDSDEFEVNFDGDIINAEDVDSKLKSFEGKSIALEATTLGFVELFLCSNVIQSFESAKIQILYVEPLSYKTPSRSKILHKRDFALSEVIHGYKAIPGAVFRMSDHEEQSGVFFLGYEENRLDRALEDFQMIRPNKVSVVFGVPAFKPGWEMDAFANNIRVIRNKNISGGIHFCGAENPAATVELLTEVYEGLDRSVGEKMFIAPIGTKPNGIGAALFASIKDDVGILYDHPKRLSARSKKTAQWHLYDVNFNEAN